MTTTFGDLEIGEFCFLSDGLKVQKLKQYGNRYGKFNAAIWPDNPPEGMTLSECERTFVEPDTRVFFDKPATVSGSAPTARPAKPDIRRVAERRKAAPQAPAVRRQRPVESPTPSASSNGSSGNAFPKTVNLADLPIVGLRRRDRFDSAPYVQKLKALRPDDGKGVIVGECKDQDEVRKVQGRFANLISQWKRRGELDKRNYRVARTVDNRVVIVLEG